MQLIRRQESWAPFRAMMEDFSNRMNRLFRSTSLAPEGEREMLAMTDWSPACDICETDKEYRIEAELPNVKREDVHVTLENGILTIQGQRREAREETGVRYHRRELSYGSFLRRFTMPSDADESKVDASFKDGVLNVVIAKSKEKSGKTKEIAVH